MAGVIKGSADINVTVSNRLNIASPIGNQIVLSAAYLFL